MQTWEEIVEVQVLLSVLYGSVPAWVSYQVHIRPLAMSSAAMVPPSVATSHAGCIRCSGSVQATLQEVVEPDILLHVLRACLLGSHAIHIWPLACHVLCWCLRWLPRVIVAASDAQSAVFLCIQATLQEAVEADILLHILGVCLLGSP